MTKKVTKLFQDLLLSISVFLFSYSTYGQYDKNISIQKAIDVEKKITDVIVDYLETEDHNCSDSEFYYSLLFYQKDKFIIARVFEDYNNFLENCDGYLDINGKYFFLENEKHWTLYLSETGRYKNFISSSLKNEHFIPFGYQGDAKFYKIEKGEILLERTEKCHKKD